MQLSLGIIGLLVFLSVFLIFPETCHPGERGLDKVDPSSLPTWRPIFINPLKSLWLLRSPALLAVVGLAAGFVAFDSHSYPFNRLLRVSQR
jgi:hypothetical protein